MTDPIRNVFKQQIKHSEKDISVDDILKCTGGGQAIGAKIVRNMNRLLLLPNHGWVTQGKLHEDTIVLIRSLAEEHIQDIKDNPAKVHNYKELKAEAKEARKLAELSKTLFENDEIFIQATQAQASRLATLTALKAINPNLLARAALMLPPQSRPELLQDFVTFIQSQDHQDIHSLYSGFLGSLQNKVDLEEDFKTLQNTIKDLTNAVIDRSFRDEKLDSDNLSERDLSLVFGKIVGTTGSILSPQDTKKLDQDEISEGLNEQFYKDCVLRSGRNKVTLENESVPIHKGPQLTDVEARKISWKEYIPFKITAYLNNDETKMRRFALMMTQASDIEGLKAILNTFQIPPESLKFESEIKKINGQTMMHVINTFGEAQDENKTPRWQTILTVNLDDLDAPAHLQIKTLE